MCKPSVLTVGSHQQIYILRTPSPSSVLIVSSETEPFRLYPLLYNKCVFQTPVPHQVKPRTTHTVMIPYGSTFMHYVPTYTLYPGCFR